jgi:hypothetical protein
MIIIINIILKYILLTIIVADGGNFGANNTANKISNIAVIGPNILSFEIFETDLFRYLDPLLKISILY